jgi:hypothetical protein
VSETKVNASLALGLLCKSGRQSPPTVNVANAGICFYFGREQQSKADLGSRADEKVRTDLFTCRSAK